MRIMQVGHSHLDYLLLFAERFPHLDSFDARMQAYLDDHYWCGHTVAPALQRMGHETFFCVPMDALSQYHWCQEHGVVWEDDFPEKVFLTQVAWFQPDVLYIGSACMYLDSTLSLLPYKPKLVVGWHATLTWPSMEFSCYDLMLSSHEECLIMARENGANETAFAYPGVAAELAGQISREKRTDICFSGYWAESHLRRNQFLYDLAKRLRTRDVRCDYHLGFYHNGPPCPRVVEELNRGPVWGRAMYEAFGAAKVVLNGHATINFGPQNLSPNLRQLEALNAGSFLLTEQSDNMSAFFTAGDDMVTYASADELVERAMYYLAHDEEREAIAAHGQVTALRCYNMDVRAGAFLETVTRYLHKGAGIPYESLVRTLRSLAAARDDKNAPPGEDVERIVQESLAASRDFLLKGAMENGLFLLDAIEPLPVDGMKDLNLCRALRAVANGALPEGETLLRRELDAWPGNDLARQSLSRLVLGKPLWS